ncbi:rhodanese-like domain-containing protein [Fulvivirga sp. 29W222]|uniref:Rhodanese-like domain-containing protein n=1 Tax=Fulvivirga marina TaxID=2494733 RepID=A0A937KBV9_9BACT|nr:rhodanese-like domain-containing protein [Fulvivirga marina]MBL6446792.1 rhodanese-like domain-containing protein [Fulvivirga marina]
MLEVAAKELKRRLANKEELYIIDVRECWEYDEVNIGATNIPLGELPQHLSQLPSRKDMEIIVHCQSGRRSGQAQKYLAKQGYSNVTSLKGGLDAYLRLK